MCQWTQLLMYYYLTSRNRSLILVPDGVQYCLWDCFIGWKRMSQLGKRGEPPSRAGWLSSHQTHNQRSRLCPLLQLVHTLKESLVYVFKQLNKCVSISVFLGMEVLLQADWCLIWIWVIQGIRGTVVTNQNFSGFQIFVIVQLLKRAIIPSLLTFSKHVHWNRRAHGHNCCRVRKWHYWIRWQWMDCHCRWCKLHFGRLPHRRQHCYQWYRFYSCAVFKTGHSFCTIHSLTL